MKEEDRYLFVVGLYHLPEYQSLGIPGYQNCMFQRNLIESFENSQTFKGWRLFISVVSWLM